MRFFITDDDPAVRRMLAQLIEDEDLGEVAGEAADGADVDAGLLAVTRTDIWLIDLLMPKRDGIETVREIAPSFPGKIIMLSQVESKDMIGEAYALGVEYYITKPINRLEVLSVIRKVEERMRLARSIQNIRQSLLGLDDGGLGKAAAPRERDRDSAGISAAGRYLFSELGITGEIGCKDLLAMLQILAEHDDAASGHRDFPQLRELFRAAAVRKLGDKTDEAVIKKEIKAAEQRVRRTIHQALSHLASLGLTDYSNIKFENYASKFFDFTEVRKRMLELEDESGEVVSQVRINVKKFIQVLYLEAKQRMREH
ncbi:response regulator [Paenibacillus ehimensis]|uniref:Response regulator n=1 Tax=Paenibacillus ehimensis TaxID=79264 RepID=A0ABT8V359_9BACL|nr:response regulator [Paenibacillus ehimensis]MDO3675863.1 response regulator [Paenibacillus ehimensis]